MVVFLVSLASASKAHGCSEYDGCSDSNYSNNDSYLTYPDTSYSDYSNYNTGTTYTSTAYYYNPPVYQDTSYPDYQSNYTYNPSYQYTYSSPSYTGSYQYPTIKKTSGPITATCYPQPLSTYVGTTVQWMSSVSGGVDNYNITWIGDEGLYGYGPSITKTYNTSGSKTASISVISGGQTTTVNCSNSINVMDNVSSGNYYQFGSYNNQYSNYNNYNNYGYNSYNNGSNYGYNSYDNNSNYSYPNYDNQIYNYNNSQYSYR